MMEACFISCQLSNHKYKTKPDDVNVFFFFINWPFLISIIVSLLQMARLF